MTSHRTHCGSGRSIKDLLGCILGKKGKGEKLLPHVEKKRMKKKSQSPIPMWSLICRLWIKLRIKSPRGPEPTCSPYPFVQTSTKDNRKRFEPGVPWAPNLASSIFFLSLLSSDFFHTPFFTSVCLSLALFLLFPLKSPSSSYTTL